MRINLLMPSLSHYHVLLVEDDLTIAGNLFTYFEAEGFVPDVAYDGHSALHRLGQEPFDAVVLDIGLPGLDGLRVLHRLREELRLDTPVLLLTARDQLEEKLDGFAHGADDYVTKPFALAEVVARVRALLARSQRRVTSAVREFGGLRFDTRTHEVTVHGKPVHVARKGAQILDALLRDPGRVVSRVELENMLWGVDVPENDALRSQIHLLRRALAEAGFQGIQTAHGVGWRLVDVT